MRKTILFIILTITLNSCGSDLKGFEFSNFENTPLWELSKAVKEDDVIMITKILKSNQFDIDYKEPIHMQTLLTLAIVNRKQEAFIELLKAKANPNILLGSNEDSTPLIEAILNQDNCDLYYIENLLKYGANPNLEIISKDTEHFFFNSYPLFVAIRIGVNGDECLDIIKILIKYGADINCCNPRPMTDNMCEGVINECISMSCMDFLRYFIIEKKIKIPKIVYTVGGINKATQKEYSLTEILNTEDFRFEDFEDETGKVDLSKPRKARNEILEYLKKTEQK